VTSWPRYFVTVALAGHASSLWPMIVAPIAAAMVLRPALCLIETMPPGSPRQRQMAFLASIIPGVLFSCCATSASRLMPFSAMHSASCFVHCAILGGVFAFVPVRSLIRIGRQAAQLRLLMRFRQSPSPPLERAAAALHMRSWELPVDEPFCCVAGVFTPRVLVSTGAVKLLSEDELRAALLHERAHLRTRETLWLAIAAFLNQSSLVGSPRALSVFRHSGDYWADREAVQHTDPAILASALLRFSRFEQVANPLISHLAAGGSCERRTGFLTARLPMNTPRVHVATAALLLMSAASWSLLPTALRLAREAWGCRC